MWISVYVVRLLFCCKPTANTCGSNKPVDAVNTSGNCYVPVVAAARSPKELAAMLPGSIIADNASDETCRIARQPGNNFEVMGGHWLNHYGLQVEPDCFGGRVRVDVAEAGSDFPAFCFGAVRNFRA